MEVFLNERMNKLLEEIELYREMGIPAAKRLAGILQAVQAVLKDLRGHIAANPFVEEAAEIAFFKIVKPKFVAEQLYAVELYSLETNRPVGDELALKAYYEFELKHIRRFFEQHRFMHQYYLLDGHELDHLYFVRGAAAPVVITAELPSSDPEFSTAADYLYAKFIAYERLQEHLAGLLYPSAGTLPAQKKRLPWPGEKTDLIEFAYALYCWLRFKKSERTIVEIIEWLEESFGITLPRHYRRFAEIKMRKV
ncbi:RteC domain-containing protein [Mucilaginibacter auburnensis]|uniref:RteC protein n=1 Tax=Mucilaginibacter auburnensis TaxID=1457233 RepID=A0A2H9VR38_9SPHI|nr:RteC domain-containing protein [Mucilaginibacter auburnensis]PJJ83297.1 RteC protein [Mucilaginibacter auburnensis]